MRTVAGLLVAVVCMVVAGCGGDGASGDLIAFDSDRDGDYEVFVMNADGTEVRQLTDNDDRRDGFPAWSPDGKRIAFHSDRDRDGDWEVFVMNADGSEVRQLTDWDDWDDAYPAWSPDGERIAFSRNHRDGGGEVFVMNADGSEVRQLTNRDTHADVGTLAWSLDGKRIAFDSKRGGDQRADLVTLDLWEIFVMNADGTQVRQLTDNDNFDGFPAWSPDGKRIAFSSDRDGDFEIFVMDADGSEVRQLNDNDGWDDGFPAWSPDGKRIAFSSDRDGDFEIFVMKADGSDVYSTGQEGVSSSWGG